MDIKLKFRQDTRCMARSLLERGHSPSEIGSFVTLCKSIGSHLVDTGVYIDDVERALALHIDKLIGKGVQPARERLLSCWRRRIVSYIENGAVDFSLPPRNKENFIGGVFDEQFLAYVGDLSKRGMAVSTVVKWKGYAHRFFSYLHSLGLTSLNEIKVEQIDSFLVWISSKHAKSGVAGELTMLRSVLSFSDAKGITDNARWLVPQGRYVRSAPVPALTDEEIAAVIAMVDNSTALGKRNLAIMMLAIKMGVRSSEITALEIDDIHWDDATILIRQKKVRSELMLPAPKDVLDALSDYLINGRPKSVCDVVFLTSRAPFTPFAHGCELWSICKPYYARQAS